MVEEYSRLPEEEVLGQIPGLMDGVLKEAEGDRGSVPCACVETIVKAIQTLEWASDAALYEAVGIEDPVNKLWPQPPEIQEKHKSGPRMKDFKVALDEAVKCGLDPIVSGGMLRGQDMRQRADRLVDRLEQNRADKDVVREIDYLFDGMNDAVGYLCRK